MTQGALKPEYMIPLPSVVTPAQSEHYTVIKYLEVYMEDKLLKPYLIDATCVAESIPVSTWAFARSGMNIDAIIGLRSVVNPITIRAAKMTDKLITVWFNKIKVLNLSAGLSEGYKTITISP